MSSLVSNGNGSGDVRHQLPVPPLRLRRIWLHGVGPKGARFDPLDLNFAIDDAAASRVLLSLTNTGGKSTLITLLSSVIVPAALKQVGRKNLGDYVLTGDTSHVVCEWEDASTRARTVIGSVMEWKDGKRQPPETQRALTSMNRTFYLFQTGDGLPGIDDLPFIVGDKRSSRDQFIASIDDLFAKHPKARGLWTTKQNEWATALDANTSLDPVLFTYQMRMNDSESGAEALLASFNTPENVVRFFVDALNDDRATGDFATNLTEYAKVAANRPQLEALVEFCAHAGPAVAEVARSGAADMQARGALQRAVTDGAELVAALRARIAADTAMLAELEESAENAAQRASDLRRDVNAIPDIRAQLRLEQARHNAQAAGSDAVAAEQEANERRLEAAGWEAVHDVVTADDAQIALDAAREAFDRAHEGLEPLRSAVDAAGAALGARLDALITESEHAKRTAEVDHGNAKTAMKNAVKATTDADRALGDAGRALTDANTAIDTAAKAADDALARHLIRPGESATAAEHRWTTARDTARESAKLSRAEESAANTAFDNDEPVLAAAQTEHGHAEQAHTAARELLESFDSEFAVVSANPSIVAMLDGQANNPTDLTRARGLCEAATTKADRLAGTHEAAADKARGDLAHLVEHGTAPPGPDVLTVRDLLTDEARIGAATGLEWVERNIGEAHERAAFITAHPEIAGGVIITDPSRFGDAVLALESHDLALRAPITATVAPDLSNPPGTTQRRHVVLPHRATWDRTWAEQRRTELETTERRESEAGRIARDAATAHRNAIANVAAFEDRWGQTNRRLLDEGVRSGEVRLTVATTAVATVTDRRRTNREAAATHRATAEKADGAERRAATNLTPVADLVVLVDLANDARERKPHLEQSRVDALNAKSSAQSDHAAAVAAFDDAATRIEQHGAQTTKLREARAQLPHTSAPIDPGGSLSSAEDRYRDATQILLDATNGMVEADRLSRAQRHQSESATRLTRHDPGAIERARQLAETVEGTDHSHRARSVERSRAIASQAQKQLLRASAHHDTAQARVVELSPSDPTRANHADLSTSPRWNPAQPDQIDRILADLEQHNITLRDQVAKATGEEADAKELLDAVRGDIDGFSDTTSMWTAPDPVIQSVPPFEGLKENARTEMRGLIAAHSHADRQATTAANALSSAITTARRAGSDPRWADLQGSLPVRIRTLDDDALVDEAASLDTTITAMTVSARGDLDNMDTHRTILRDSLIQLCAEQRSLLRDVASSSRLPDGLGGLTGQTALKIDFETAAETEAAARLAGRIDHWSQDIASNPTRAPNHETKIKWLADAVAATVVDRPRAGRFTIKVLKPSLDGTPYYCSPDRIPDEFSGGQVLTLAVLVYCSLSKVRSSRRASGPRPAGTLLLDNPFGAASAEQLIAMQHRLAAHNGIQLVCATGIHDPGVDAAFSGPGSVITKLRNDSDVRRHLSYLRLRAAVVEGVSIADALTGTRPLTDRRAQVHATTYHVHR